MKCPSVRTVSTSSNPKASRPLGQGRWNLARTCIFYWLGTELLGSGILKFGPCTGRDHPELSPDGRDDPPERAGCLYYTTKMCIAPSRQANQKRCKTEWLLFSTLLPRCATCSKHDVKGTVERIVWRILDPIGLFQVIKLSKKVLIKLKQNRLTAISLHYAELMLGCCTDSCSLEMLLNDLIWSYSEQTAHLYIGPTWM